MFYLTVCFLLNVFFKDVPKFRVIQWVISKHIFSMEIQRYKLFQGFFSHWCLYFLFVFLVIAFVFFLLF